MKRTTILFAAVLVLISAPFARAEGSLSDAQLEAIRTNCVNAQISLQHAQESDRFTRVNRGYRYEAILKLMTNFNSRVVENKVDAPELITIASDYQKNWDLFRKDYTAYDNAMDALVKMDCKDQPTTFNDQLVALREKRTSLNGRVRAFDTLLDRYQTGVNSVKYQEKTE